MVTTTCSSSSLMWMPLVEFFLLGLVRQATPSTSRAAAAEMAASTSSEM